MAKANSTSPGVVYGMVTLDGIQYVERHQVFGAEVTINTPGQLITNLRLTLPGVANFLLKCLTRDFVKAQDRIDSSGPPEPIFKFRLVNYEGTTWFTTGGLGLFDDRVFADLSFGDAQFPFPLIPQLPVHATGSLIYELEDSGILTLANNPTVFPYTNFYGLQGSYLFPVEDVATKGPLAFPGVTHGIIRSR